MNQYIVDTRIRKGNLKLNDIPLDDETEVKVIVMPKINLLSMSFQKIQQLTKPIKDNLSDDIVSERDNR